MLPAIKYFDPFYLQFITTLNLSNLGLKHVPLVIRECKCLQELILRKNHLENIPTGFIVYHFPFLKILDLSENYLTSLKQIINLGTL